MRNSKLFRNLYIVGILLVVIVVAATIVFTNQFENASSSSAYAENAIIVSDVIVKDGYLYDSSNAIISGTNDGKYVKTDDRYHMTSAGAAAAYTGKTVTPITNGDELREYLATGTSSTVGVLMNDINYNMQSYSENQLKAVCAREFTGTLDGNAYKLTITSLAKQSTLDAYFNRSYTTLLLGVSTKDQYSGYEFTGMLCGVNKGTFTNLNISWTGDLGANATMSSGDVLVVSGNGVGYTPVVGLICGLNHGGTISNCNVSLDCAFSIAKSANNSNTNAVYNFTIVGGMVGALYDGKIERCTLDNDKGVLSLADGSRDGSNNKSALAVAGGIAGILWNNSTARIVNCTLDGDGSVIAECGHDVKNRSNDGARGYCGGVTAGAFVITKIGDWFSKGGWDFYELKDGQVDGILSGWTGTSSFRWKDSSSNIKLSYSGCLFSSVGNENAIRHITLLYDYVGESAESSSNRLDTLDYNGTIPYGSWVEVYPENDFGTVSAGYDYSKLSEYKYKQVKNTESFDTTAEYYTRTGEGTDASPYVYTKAEISAFASGTTYYRKEIGDLIRVEAVANGYTPTTFATSSVATHEELTGKGYFIWALKEYEEEWRGNSSAVAAVSINTSNNYVAHLNYISPSSSGAFVYAFGEKATLEYIDTNDSAHVNNYSSVQAKYYDKTTFNVPEIRVKRQGINNYASINENAYRISATYTKGLTYDVYKYIEASNIYDVNESYYKFEEYSQVNKSQQPFDSSITYYTRTGSGTTTSPYVYAAASITQYDSSTTYFVHDEHYVSATIKTFTKGTTYYVKDGDDYNEETRFTLDQTYYTRSGEGTTEDPFKYKEAITGSTYYIRVIDEDMLYLPGTYVLRSTKYITDADTTYAYYDESAYILVDYEESNKYEYRIISDNGTLFTANATSSAINWLKSDEITFTYANVKGAIDYYRYRAGSTTSIWKTEGMPENATQGSISLTESGKITYQLEAYINNPYYTAQAGEEAAFLVGSTNVQTFVDNKPSIIDSIKYYQYDESAGAANCYKGMRISVDDLDYYQDTDIVVVFQVKDEGLSGVNTGSGYAGVVSGLPGDTTWTVYLILTEDEPSKSVYFIDVAGNQVEYTFKALIDTTDLGLEKVKPLNGGAYLSYYAQLGYCPDTVKITFTPVFGASGAFLQYSYQQDDQGNDIWIDYASSFDAYETYYTFNGVSYEEVEGLTEYEKGVTYYRREGYVGNYTYIEVATNITLKSSQPNTFIIDFEIIKSKIKMRLVSKIYGTSYVANANGTEEGYISNGQDDFWTVKIIVAGLGITLDNLYYEGAPLKGRTDLDTLFNKDYDASNTSELEVTAKIYSSGTTPITGTNILYSDLYTLSKPQILEEYLKVVITYSTANAGNNRTVTIRVNSVDSYQNKYLVRFADTEVAILNTLLDDYPASYDITTKAKINKKALAINLADYPDQLSTSYSFGDAIPSQITVKGLANEDIALALVINPDGTNVYPNIGSYNVDAVFADNSDNYDLSVTKTNFTIGKKVVVVTPKMDGNERFNTTLVFDGNKHEITGTYIDVDGKEKKADITYYALQEETLVQVAKNEGVTAIKTYYIVISIEDENYAVGNINGKNLDEPIEFTIDKGFLELKLDEQTVTFNGKTQDFEIKTVLDVEKKYYDPNDNAFTIKYYLVENGIASSEALSSAPSKVGKYLVLVTYGGSTYFYDSSTYKSTYLTIEKAETKAEAEDIEIAYDAADHEFKVVDAKFKVTANNGTTSIIFVNSGELNYTKFNGADKDTLVGSAALAMVTVSTYDAVTGGYKQVSDTNEAIYSDAGTYRLKITFNGDENFKDCSCEIEMVITPAKFEGLTFDSVEFNYVDSSAENYHSIVVRGDTLEQYLNMGAKIKYTYMGTKYKDNGELAHDLDTGAEWIFDSTTTEENPLKFSNVGAYLITATVTLDNFETAPLTAYITINKAKMPTATAIEVTTIYDGEFHPAKFKINTGLDVVEYYVKGYEAIKYIQYIKIGSDIINVRYNDDAAPIDAGVYYGQITLTSPSFADQVIETKVTISQKQVEDVKFDELEDISKKIYSNTNLKNLTASFRDVDGEMVTAEFEYYKKNADGSIGEKVELNSDGTLDAGTYIVKIAFDDGNYYTTQEAEITVAQASSKDGNKDKDRKSDDGSSFMDKIKPYILYIAIGGGVLVAGIIAVIVIAVVKGKKKPKKKPKKGTPPKRNGPPPRRHEETITKKKGASEPVKKKKASIEDKAQF